MSFEEKDKTLSDLLIKKEYSIEELINIFKDVHFYYPRKTPYDLYIEEKKINQGDDYKFTFEERKNFTGEIEKEYSKKISDIVADENKSIQLIEKYLIDDYHPKGATPKELFLWHCKRKALMNEKDKFYGTLYGLLKWKEMTEEEKNTWEELKAANDRYWDRPKGKIIGETAFIKLYDIKDENFTKNFDSICKEYKEKMRETTRKRLIYILNNKKNDNNQFLPKKNIIALYFPHLIFIEGKDYNYFWKCPVEGIVKSMSQEEKNLFVQLCHIFDLIKNYMLYYEDNKKKLKLEETVNAKYCYFMSIKDQIVPLDLKVKEKVQLFYKKWNELTEKEKSKFEKEAKQCFDRFYTKEEKPIKDLENSKNPVLICLYMRMCIPLLQEKYPQLSHREICEILSKQWREMNEKIRANYIKDDVSKTALKNRSTAVKKRIRSAYK